MEFPQKHLHWGHRREAKGREGCLASETEQRKEAKWMRIKPMRRMEAAFVFGAGEANASTIEQQYLSGSLHTKGDANAEI